MTVERAVRWVVAVAASVTLAGCGEEPRACTLIGAESQVTVAWDAAAFPAGALYRLCADQICREGKGPAEDAPFGSFTLPLPEADGEQRMTVRFRVTDPVDGSTAYDRSAQVTLRKSQPNGEHCDPTVWQAAVRADPKAGLAPVR
ncbi:hypothetical protein AB0B30_16850 [Streptomyces narbonensis]|uniref:Lipoprotein n=1 Tax=Streptomyces narbonensis TaxID=67333 RepID=A0ABV3C9J7_9ACTN